MKPVQYLTVKSGLKLSPVHSTCVWLCLLCLGVQTGNDVSESGRGMRGMTSHCCVWLCLRWLKFFRHRDTGTKVVYFGAFDTICARRLCPESCRGEGVLRSVSAKIAELPHQIFTMCTAVVTPWWGRLNLYCTYPVLL